MDQQAMDIIRNIVGSFYPGLPLGNLTSQLFANVYLNALDHFVKERLGAAVYVRYCDDFVIAHTSRSKLLEWLSEIRAFLTERLYLTLHPDKITLRPYRHGIDWLGYVLYPDRCIVRPSTRRRMWKRVRLKVDQYASGLCMQESLNSTFASYDGLLKHSWNSHDRKLLLRLAQSI